MRWGGRLGWLAAIALVVAAPLVLDSSYWRSILLVIALNTMLAAGLNLILGYAGQLHLGLSAFYGIGAYVSTLLVKLAGFGFWPALLCGTLAAGAAGIVLALFAVRLKGHYLGIATLGFALITYQVLMSWVSLTQGPLGIYGVAPPPAWDLPVIGRIRFSSSLWMFYLVATFALGVQAVLASLVRSPFGATLLAIREDEVSASALGINCPFWKLVVFAIGCAIAGLAGCFYAPFVGTLVPDAFFVTESFTMLAMTIVGGLGTLTGPVIGAVILTVLPELLRGIGDLRLIVYGLALTLVVLFMPGGIVQGWSALRRRAAAAKP
jgi:branched-chain amino acid transport system permease protein